MSSSLRQSEGAIDVTNMLGPIKQKLKALMPEAVFFSNPSTAHLETSHYQELLALEFSKLILYMVSNNFFEWTPDTGKKLYQWIRHHSHAHFLDCLL